MSKDHVERDARDSRAVRSPGNKRAMRDAGVLGIASVVAWLLIERTDACTRFFAYVAANPDMELDSAILAGILAAVGILLFAIRRWMESARSEAYSLRLAYNDPLTQLPNRRAFAEALASATKPGQPPCACLLIDLDNFKQVNDLRGHVAGDEMLQAVADRMQEFQTRGALIARIGGDEFAMITEVRQPERSERLARRIAQRLAEPLLIHGCMVQTGVSVGIARFPADAECAEALLQKADIALYRAKSNGRGTVQTFVRDMEETERRRAAVVDALREAIPRNEIVPHYQPIIDLASGDVVGFEALARWTSSRLGVVEPREFIPISLESGLINALSTKLLEQACTDAAGWPRPLRISFNIAPPQLVDALFPLQVLSILGKTGLAATRLEIELTEDALIQNKQTASANLITLKNQGVTLALDDFGTGYSSLHHLRTLKFDKVKLDRSYVRDLEHCQDARRMVQAVVDFSHALGIPVVVEGVENAEQARILQQLGCDLAQGWLYAPALPQRDLSTFLGRSLSTALTCCNADVRVPAA